MNLENKRFAVFGVANDKSICWPIVEKLCSSGALVTLVSHPVNEKRVRKLATTNERIGEPLWCDVEDVESLTACFAHLAHHRYHGMVHGIAFSNAQELEGRFVDTSAANFAKTMHVSVFSLVELAKRMESLLEPGSSIITLSFDASRGTYPNYNVMGIAKGALETAARYLARDLGERAIRVNVVSPSPEDTLSARGISNFRRIGDFAEAMSPLGRRATLEEVAHTAVFLLSPQSSGINGQTVLVDCGASTTIMPPPRHARKMATAMSIIASLHEGTPLPEVPKPHVPFEVDDTYHFPIDHPQ
jgi:enoyl-[acyl-carrier protein] reductase I